MKSIKGLLSHLVLTILFMFSLLLFAKQAFAQDEMFDNAFEETQQEDEVEVVTAPPLTSGNINSEINDGTIEIVYPAEAVAPYRERRGDWAIVAGVNIDLIYPDKFRSKIDSLSYDSMFESYPMSMAQLELGGKYNTSIGSFGIGLSGGYGEIQGTISAELRKLSLMKLAASGTYTLDTLFSEPYVAPYIGAQIVQFNWQENKPNTVESKSGSTSPALGITMGVLLQVNWIEPDVSLQAQTHSGLQNTFIDLFISQYNTSTSETDPNFETAMNFGGGLKLEF